MAYSTEEVQAYIRQEAARRGIDPATALRVFKQESSFNPLAKNISSKEESYGVTQLNAMGGLGEVALKKGIDIRNPDTWRDQVNFSLDTVAKDGWRQWYGARDVGIGRWDGIGGRPASAPATAAAPAQGVIQGIQSAAAAPAQDTSGYGGKIDPWAGGMRTPGATVANPNSGAGLIAMLQNDLPMSWDKAKTFLGTPGAGQTGSPLGGAVQGLGLLAGLGAKPQQAAPPPMMLQDQSNTPDMGLLSMLLPKKKKGLSFNV